MTVSESAGEMVWDVMYRYSIGIEGGCGEGGFLSGVMRGGGDHNCLEGRGYWYGGQIQHTIGMSGGGRFNVFHRAGMERGEGVDVGVGGLFKIVASAIVQRWVVHFFTDSPGAEYLTKNVPSLRPAVVKGSSERGCVSIARVGSVCRGETARHIEHSLVLESIAQSLASTYHIHPV
ncbi:hypothetical protein Tco_0868719 [Tanacetum coccineum]